MFKKILSTAAVRVLHSTSSLIILMINAQLLGAANVGTIGLIVLGVTIVLAMNNFVGGTALVYLTPRFSPLGLWLISYTWAFIAIALALGIDLAMGLLPGGYTFLPAGYKGHVLALSLIQSFNMVNQNILLGKEKVKLYNMANFTLTIAMISSLVCIYLIDRYNDAISYVWVLYASYGSGFLISMISVAGLLDKKNAQSAASTIANLFRYGAFNQMANFIQLMNLRLAYFFLEKYTGRFTLGIYTAGNQLSEGVWIVSRSISIVQYSRISNTKDQGYAKRLTISLIKVAMLITLALLALLLVMPVSVYTSIFGAEFTEVKTVIALLSPGILALSAYLILSNYFSGRGKHHINAIGAGIGFVATLTGCLLLIPAYGLHGAAISAVGSYLFTSAFHLSVFVRQSHAKFNEFIPSGDDYLLIKTEIKKMMSKQAKTNDSGQ